MSIEDDVREIRLMFANHITNENTIFTTNAQEHGVILTKLDNIEKRLEDGTISFDDHEVRLNSLENSRSNLRGWGSALIFVTGIAVKLLEVLFDKIGQIF